MIWNKSNDTIKNKIVQIDSEADTKRKLLQTLNRVFYPLGIGLLACNRAKLFFHELQSNSKLSWDDKISESLQKTLRKICRRYNSSIDLTVPRYVCDYTGLYDLIEFTDASKKCMAV